MKRNLFLLLTIVSLMLTGCGFFTQHDFKLDESMKKALEESISEQTIEIFDIEGMAYFRLDADCVQLVDINGKPISYENGKKHDLLSKELEFGKDDLSYTYIIEDSDTGVKWLYSCKTVGSSSFFWECILFEADTDLIIGENGLPKID